MSCASAQATEASGEEREADREEPAAAEAVGERAGGQHDARERERVGVDDPLQAAQARVEVLGDARQRRVDDGDVEHQHRGGRADHREGPALGALPCVERLRGEREGRGRRALSPRAGPRVSGANRRMPVREPGFRLVRLPLVLHTARHGRRVPRPRARRRPRAARDRDRRLRPGVAAPLRGGARADRARRSATARCGSSTSARPPSPAWPPSRSSTSSSRSPRLDDADLERAGYVLRVREEGHRMFRTPELDVHVHVWPSGLAEHRRATSPSATACGSPPRIAPPTRRSSARSPSATGTT